MLHITAPRIVHGLPNVCLQQGDCAALENNGDNHRRKIVNRTVRVYTHDVGFDLKSFGHLTLRFFHLNTMDTGL